MPVSDSDARLVGLVRELVPVGDKVGVALSGGGDSVALLHLCLKAQIPVEAVTVDHRLRNESAAEARAMAMACKMLGIRHEVRVWQHGVVAGNLMDEARRARMGLIGSWARDRGIARVMLGHTRDDQAETMLMALARRSGIDGLSGMRRTWVEGGVQFLRPLMAAGRAELRDWLRSAGVGWIDDPTNEDDRFLRVRARKALVAMEPLGVTSEGLAAVAGHLAEVRLALEAQLAAAASEVLRQEAGSVVVERAAFVALPAELQRKIVGAAMIWVSGADQPLRADGIGRVVAAICDGKDATLGGCRIRKGARILREMKAVAGTVCLPGAQWDGRWRVTGPDLPGAEVRALGAAGLRQTPGWREVCLPRDVLEVTPSVWVGDVLVAAPLAGFGTAWSARIDAPVELFGLSH